MNDYIRSESVRSHLLKPLDRSVRRQIDDHGEIGFATAPGKTDDECALRREVTNESMADETTRARNPDSLFCS